MGHETCSRVAKRGLAEGRRVADIVLEEGLLAPEQIERLLQLEAMTRPSRSARIRALATVATGASGQAARPGDAAAD